MDIKTAEYFMKIAVSEAVIALRMGEIPVGALVVSEGNIIARAHNMRETLSDPTAHAELLAISLAAKKKGNWRLCDAVLFSTLEPCPMCAGAVLGARLSHVYYGAFDKQYGCCGSVYRITEDPVFPGYVETTGGILIDECKAVLDGYFKNCRSRDKKGV